MRNILRDLKKGLELENIDNIEDLEYQGVVTWDSVGHMALIAELEESFDIMMETDDIIDFSSFKKGIEILKKYDVDIEVEENVVEE